MNPSSFHALIIDQHFGELSPEASELLEQYLEQNAGARAEAERILDSLAVTRAAVLRHPELARVAPEEKAGSSARTRMTFRWLARAAALVAFAALAATTGFIAGRSGPRSQFAGSEPANPAASIALTASRTAGPWARYRMAFDPSGGMQVIRVDPAERHGTR